jgi:hypothetical protein
VTLPRGDRSRDPEVWQWQHTRADGSVVVFASAVTDYAPYWCETHLRACSVRPCPLCEVVSP